MDRVQTRRKLQLWDKAYASGKPLVSDVRYDKLRAKFAEAFPQDKYLQTVNTANEPGAKVTLPRQMLSMGKERPSTIQNWFEPKAASAFIISPKFDGIACKLIYKDGKLIAGYKRGNGIIGRDVSHLVSFINGVMPRIKNKNIKEVDGEIVIQKSTYAQHYARTKEYSNSRAFVAGTMNSKTATSKIKQQLANCMFVVYNMHAINDKYWEDKWNVLLAASILNFPTVLNPKPWLPESYAAVQQGKTKRIMSSGIYTLGKTVFDNAVDITADLCKHYIRHWSEIIDIDLDGIVVEYSRRIVREKLGITGKIPNYVTAVKSEIADQKFLIGDIAKVELNISPRGLFKPTGVLKKALFLGGVDVTRCTLHNMKTVLENGIGVGAKVRMIRSGDVIPRFVKTEQKSTVFIPRTCPYCSSKLEWTEKLTDLRCSNANCQGFLQERVVSFFKKFKIDNLGEKNVVKLMKAGYNSVPKILVISPQRLSKIDGLALPSATKIVRNMQEKLKKVSLPELMWASCIFSTEAHSFGKTRFEAIIKHFKQQAILDRVIPNDFVAQLLTIDGIGLILAETFAENLPVFREFYKSLPDLTLEKAAKTVQGKLSGKTFCWTSYRSSEEEDYVRANDGVVAASVSRKTTVLFCANEGSTKAVKARSLGVKLVKQVDAMKWLKAQ